MSLSLLSELNNSSLNELNKENNKNLNYKSKKIFKNNLGLNTSPINRRINSSNVKYNSSPKSYVLKKNNSSSNYSNTSSSKNLNRNHNNLLKNVKKVKKEKSYELVDFPKHGNSYGTYKGSTPKQAAKKAFSKLARLSHLNNSNQKFIVFVIRAKVPNKNGIKREFKYMGQRVKLEHGIEIKRGNKTVTIKYKNIVNKFKDLNH
jgi:hypothetical protein